MKIWVFPLALITITYFSCGCAQSNEESRSTHVGSSCNATHPSCSSVDLSCQLHSRTCQCKPCSDLKAIKSYWHTCKICLKLQNTCSPSYPCLDDYRQCHAGKLCECITKCRDEDFSTASEELFAAKIVLVAAAVVAMLAAVSLFLHGYYRDVKWIVLCRKRPDQLHCEHDADSISSITSVQQYVLARLHSQPPSYDDHCHVHLEGPPTYEECIASGVVITTPAIPEPTGAVLGVENLEFVPDDDISTQAEAKSVRSPNTNDQQSLERDSSQHS